MGEREKGMTLERINNDGNYEPLNCVWATQKEQNQNRRTCIMFMLNNKKLNLTQLCESLGVYYESIRISFRKGKDLVSQINKSLSRKGKPPLCVKSFKMLT